MVMGSVLMIDLRILGWAGMDQTLRQTTSRFGPWLTGSLWLLLVAKPVIGVVYRMLPVMPGPIGPGLLSKGLGLQPEWWAIVLLSAVVIHAGLHGLGLP